MRALQALAREAGRYCFRFVRFYWVCFAFPFPLDLIGLPLQLVDPQNQPDWMKAAGANYGEAYSWISRVENQACTWVGGRILSVKRFTRLAGPKPPNLAYRITWVTQEKKLTLGKFSTPAWKATFTYSLPEPDKLELEGSMDGKAIAATLKRAPEKNYEFMNRGFSLDF